MAKKGQFYPYRVTFAYPNGIGGTNPVSTREGADLEADTLLRRGADVQIYMISPDRTRHLVASMAASDYDEDEPDVQEAAPTSPGTEARAVRPEPTTTARTAPMATTITDRQLAALHERARYSGIVSSDQEAGVKEASEWLAARLAENPQRGQRPELHNVLRGCASAQMKWDTTEYDDGISAVLDDILAILDNDPETLEQWTAIANLRVEQKQRLEAVDANAQARGAWIDEVAELIGSAPGKPRTEADPAAPVAQSTANIIYGDAGPGWACETD